MSVKALDERFDHAILAPELRWHCEPDQWSVDPAKRVLRISPDAHTDFWQRTYYGFEADSGHFLHLRAPADFILTTKVTSHPCHQYDQAGLMVRVSRSCWIKTSVEFEPHETNRLGAVVTNAQYSDWSTQPLSKTVDTVWFRVRVAAADCIVESSLDGTEWQQLRMAHLADRGDAQPVSCGLYACSPKGAGYQAEFHFLTFLPGRS
jgi:regulation of enolase protein 1 (concanavalin A-like superfamily)